MKPAQIIKDSVSASQEVLCASAAETNHLWLLAVRFIRNRQTHSLCKIRNF